jgi:hypothetical protein
MLPWPAEAKKRGAAAAGNPVSGFFIVYVIYVSIRDFSGEELARV